MQQANAIEFEVRGDGEPVLLIHGAIVADSFLPMMSQPALSHYQRGRHAVSPVTSDTYSSAAVPLGD
jgi:hypothetical protein